MRKVSLERFNRFEQEVNQRLGGQLIVKTGEKVCGEGWFAGSYEKTRD